MPVAPSDFFIEKEWEMWVHTISPKSHTRSVTPSAIASVILVEP